MDISVVVPLFNEAESLPELCAWIDKVMKANNFSYEALLTDDGSNDGSWKVIEDLAKANSSLKGIHLRRNYGKSAALNVAFAQAKGNVVITMDADLQDSPDEIPDLYKMISIDGFDMVSGWKQKRYDPLTKTIPTKLFNWATRKMSGIYLHDFNCGLKAYKIEVVKNIQVHGEMHRYIPVLAKWSGFSKIGEKVVHHQSRKYGTTKFGMSRFINGFLDLLSISFMTRFGRKPMHLFGLIGTVLFMIGFIEAAVLTYDKFVNHIYKMTDRPAFYFGILVMILGTQFFLAGFIGELISQGNNDRVVYQVDKHVNEDK
ncbi:MAG TPA: glycosyltransferase family 2 protein [Bacteroidia bacterium]|jgi:glycosyltransferase involved in cell wall biosynthesis|nr:glycosyltransferase family 2 protein [Bacteroidia bacterium]